MLFFSTADVVNLLGQLKPPGKVGQMADSLGHTNLVILDELGDMLFSPSCGALLFHLVHGMAIIQSDPKRSRVNILSATSAMSGVMRLAMMMSHSSLNAPRSRTTREPKN